MHWQVVIVGAGPVGGRLATELAARGISTLLLEEHAEIGRPFQCAGLVNPPAMKKVGLENTILENVVGALINSPSGIQVPVGNADQIRTHVVCRKKFDQGVVRQAIEAGAHLWLLSRATDAVLTEKNMSVTVDRDGTEINLTCDLLIGADGAHSWTRRKFRMGRPKEFMVGFQADVTGLSENKNWLEMYTGKDVAPGLFAWVIPADKGNHRIGVWAKAEHLAGKSVEDMYDALITHPKWKSRFSGLKEISRYCGPIPCGIIPRPFKDRVMVIGDAAGMAKPTTGGGIGPGFRQVDEIIEKLTLAIKNNRLSQKDLSKVCKPYKAMRKEFARAKALRDLLVTIPTDEELDEHFKLFNKPEILELINEIGDIENPVSLGMSLLKKVPEFRKLAIKAGIKVLFA